MVLLLCCNIVGMVGYCWSSVIAGVANYFQLETETQSESEAEHQNRIRNWNTRFPVVHQNRKYVHVPLHYYYYIIVVTLITTI